MKTKLTVSEGDAVAFVSVQIVKGTLKSNITTIQLFTDDDSATSISECCQYTLISI